MNTTPIRPPRLSAFEEAFKRAAGRRISNRPSKLNPNAKKSAATPKFNQALFARFVRAVAEKKNENNTPTPVNTPMIARQYATARPVVDAPFLASPCFTKKLTVIGTIGQTQGITSASNPPSAEV